MRKLVDKSPSNFLWNPIFNLEKRVFIFKPLFTFLIGIFLSLPPFVLFRLRKNQAKRFYLRDYILEISFIVKNLRFYLFLLLLVNLATSNDAGGYQWRMNSINFAGDGYRRVELLSHYSRWWSFLTFNRRYSSSPNTVYGINFMQHKLCSKSFDEV